MDRGNMELKERLSNGFNSNITTNMDSENRSLALCSGGFQHNKRYGQLKTWGLAEAMPWWIPT